MEITVRYYAVLRETAGTASEAFSLPAGSDGMALLAAVRDRHPGLGKWIHVVRLADEQAYLSAGDELMPDSTISLIPPVSGG